MTRTEFIKEIELLGFKREIEEFDDRYVKGCCPEFIASIDENDAYTAYMWSADSGPIELTDPIMAPFDEALEALKESIEDHK